MTNQEFTQSVIDKAYPLPWTLTDNPNGWLELTRACQLSCPGCYRGLDLAKSCLHTPLADLKSQVDEFVAKRNVQAISLAGGEPLLYPELIKLLTYIRDKGLASVLYTNGLALDDDKLLELKTAGLSQLIIHIDRHQGRSEDLSDFLLHRHFLEMFRKADGPSLGFIQTLKPGDESWAKQLADFTLPYADILNLLVYTLYRDLDRPKQSEVINMSDLASVFGENWLPGAYLADTSGQPSWVFSMRAVQDNCLGWLSSRRYQLIQDWYRRKTGRYLFVPKTKKILPISFWFLLFLPKATFLRAIGRPVYTQTVLWLRPPEKQLELWQVCKNCPDAMWYQGKLIPSCLLERFERQELNFDLRDYVEVA